jgi:hypothetical protein
MKTTDVVGYTCDGEIFCISCAGDEVEEDESEPIFAQNEDWEEMVCDFCGDTLGDVEGVEA